jgi:hypothetical protein
MYIYEYIYIYITFIYKCFQLAGLFWWGEGGVREERMLVNDIEIHCICVGRKHNETHCKLVNNRGWGKGKEE